MLLPEILLNPEFAILASTSHFLPQRIGWIGLCGHY